MPGCLKGFAPPSLYDLTSTDETSANEQPSPDLSAENFLQAELGFRGKSDSWDWNLAGYHTWINDLIVRSPEEISDSDVIKDNADGFVHGVEIELGYAWSPSWRSEIAVSWMEGEVEQHQRVASGGTYTIPVDDDDDGTYEKDGNFNKVDRATDRLMPTQLHLVTRYEPADSNWWTEGTMLAVGDGDKLSLKDERDTSRIPGDGTPGYVLLGLRAGRTVGENSSIFLAAENLGDVDYRVHGSGLNGPGRNFVLSFQHSF